VTTKTRMAKPIALATILAFTLTGCAGPGEFQSTGQTNSNGVQNGAPNIFESTFANPAPCSNNDRNIGLAAGAGAGALVGGAVDKKNRLVGALLGAAAGALAGGLIGHELDNRRCALSKIAIKHGLTMEVKPLELATAPTAKPEQVGLSVSVVDTAQHTEFMSGSDVLTHDAVQYFTEIADQYSTAHTTAVSSGSHSEKILLVGHTDDTGSSELNADLSERRARAVAKLFSARGIAPENVFYQGAGEIYPIADNRTEQGRATNRRVEIIDLSDATPDVLNVYLNSRQPAYQYYRPAIAQVTAQTAEKPAYPISKAAKTKSQTQGVATTQSPRTTASRTEVASDTSAAAAEVRAPQAIPSLSGVDFGWQEVTSSTLGLNFGSVTEENSALSFLSNANAADMPVSQTCVNDRPRIAHGVKSVSTDQDIPIRDYFPGLYDTTWSSKVNGQLLALEHVAVKQDGATPVRKPTLLVWKNYGVNSSKTAAPEYQLTPDVNAYPIKEGVLYRIFVKNDGLFNCADIVFSKSRAQRGELVRETSGKYYVAAYVPTIAKQ
jgi:outer membrane protein OmpA-like peptidoglycan-associated protein